MQMAIFIITIIMEKKFENDSALLWNLEKVKVVEGHGRQAFFPKIYATTFVRQL